MPWLFPTKAVISQSSYNQTGSFQSFQIRYLSTDRFPCYAVLQQVHASRGRAELVQSSPEAN